MYDIRPWLYIGSFRETRSRALMKHHQINSILHLAAEVDHRGIDCLYVPVEDGEPLPEDAWRQGVDFVRAAHTDGRRVLVACGAGISRSTTFAIAALKEIEGISLMEAWQAVKARHPDALPHPKLWQSLGRYYDEDIPRAVF